MKNKNTNNLTLEEMNKLLAELVKFEEEREREIEEARKKREKEIEESLQTLLKILKYDDQ